MECPFIVGQKVICVLEMWWGDGGRKERVTPTKGAIYTIKAIFPDREGGTAIFLVLAELHPHDRFESNGFRPLKEHKTDISVFHRILDRYNGQKQLERT